MPGDIGVASDGEPQEDDVGGERDVGDSGAVDPEVAADLQAQLNDLNESVVETHQKLVRREENIKDLYESLALIARKRGLRYQPDKCVLDQPDDEIKAGEFVARDLDAGMGDIEIETVDDGDDGDGE